MRYACAISSWDFRAAKIVYLSLYMNLKFGKRLGWNAAETPVKFQIGL